MTTEGTRTLYCSHEGCQRSWTSAAGEAPAMDPVVDRRASGERSWHPCPDCLGEHGPIAEFAHALRARTARELAMFAAGG